MRVKLCQTDVIHSFQCYTAWWQGTFLPFPFISFSLVFPPCRLPLRNGGPSCGTIEYWVISKFLEVGVRRLLKLHRRPTPNQSNTFSFTNEEENNPKMCVRDSLAYEIEVNYGWADAVRVLLCLVKPILGNHLKITRAFVWRLTEHNMSYKALYDIKYVLTLSALVMMFQAYPTYICFLSVILCFLRNIFFKRHVFLSVILCFLKNIFFNDIFSYPTYYVS